MESPNRSPTLTTLTAFTLLLFNGVVADGNVGCQFNPNLCMKEIEYCYDDNAFGRCIGTYGNIEEDDLFRFDFSEGDLGLLEKEMNRLNHMEYRWSNTYTQCIMQAVLYVLKTGSEYDRSICENLIKNQDFDPSLEALENEVEINVDPADMAYVKFTPSMGNPHADFADEVYMPPLTPEEIDRAVALKIEEAESRIRAPHVEGVMAYHSATKPKLNPSPEHFGKEAAFASSADLKAASTRPLYKALLQKKASASGNNAASHSTKDATNPVEVSGKAVGYPKDDASANALTYLLQKKETSPSHPREASANTLVYPKEPSVVNSQDASNTFVDAFRRSVPTHFSQNYNTPDNFRSGQESKDAQLAPVVGSEYPLLEGFMPIVDLNTMPKHMQGIRNYPGFTADDLTNPMFRTQREPQQLKFDPRGYAGGIQEDVIPEELLLREQLQQDQFPGEQFQEEPFLGKQFQRGNFQREQFQEEPFLGKQFQRGNFPREQFQRDQLLEDQLFQDQPFIGNHFPREQLPDEQFLADQAPVEQMSFLGDQLPMGFNQDYNTPDKFRHGFETRDSFLGGRNGPLYDLGYQMSLNDQQPDLEPRGYTEGGMVYLPDKGGAAKNEEEAEEEALSQILSDLDPAMGWGFKRRERLDVKKPGPFFSTNNYAFKTDDEQKMKKADTKQDESSDENKDKEALSKEMLQEELMGSNAIAQRLYKLPDDLVSIPNKKELPKEDHLDPAQYDVVDTNYAYIGFQDSVREWKDGKRIVEAVAKLLRIPPDTFTNIRVDRNEVTFKVSPKHHTPGINASEVARMIVNIKDRLKKETGVTVTTAGVGDKAKLPTIMSLVSEADHNLYVFSFILIGVVGAVVISAAALYVIRRHAASREKLQNLTAPDTEASKDYQELCRARMATKPAQEASPAAQRIASLSRESDNSPSSRSSTSSWCEEPALTNMDISTGHMVLSYMEDHLRNKDRLEQEWTALCAYEAEPCASTIAQRPENASKNRYVNALPYDHARVILNELCNFGNSDYINASTITDHDPRNPAYIATQGPLSNTTPDLWQMVWEQGCVVMVMLTRLVENDVTMCHRYWPEEGSELYHIYEVHLVSEHIWCDDYLVRSFYLKNLKTGETRTVTQFHFLSWPDGGVPSSIKALLEFRRKVNKSFRGRSCPIVVHCSDGIGRTGTYCLLDMVLNRMAKGAKEIDIAATLEHIRDQRMRSVQTKQQFQFVLAAVAEEVQAILRVLPAHESKDKGDKEKEKEKEKDKEKEKQ